MKPKFFFLLLLSLYIVNCTFYIEAQATIRYVSKTGTSTPPYTSWETASDSIQKCIDYSVDGDTIYVANGVYQESLIVNKYLWLIGSSMDSTIIDGTGLANNTVNFQSDGHFQLFTIKGKGEGTILTASIFCNLTNAIISDCKIMNALDGIALVWSSSDVNRCIITNISEGVGITCAPDTCNPIVQNSIISLNNSIRRGILIDAGDITSFNNIIIGNQNSNKGIQSGEFYETSTNIITNCTVAGFNRNMDGFAADTSIIQNSISSYGSQRGITINSKTDMRNNIITNNTTGVVGPTNTNSDYNLYWNNNTNTTGGLAEHDILADPMFVNDTIPVYSGNYDCHLQKFSPAIDSGDPNILDKDGSRSDIGVYGGPLGVIYSYQDLAPREPRNLSAVVDTNYITLSWNRNTEADTAFYKVYRDTVINFQIDSTKLISSQIDTFFVQINPHNVSKYVYKITCVDNQGNESQPSTELVVNITSVSTDDYPKTISDYQLYQNYPNPFNPSTKIGYKLKERGYVKVMVYDIKGELVSVLVNKEQNAGYYEVEFVGNGLPSVPNVQGLASGIYLYRIEVIGEGRIPVFSDMKKMLMIK